MKVNIEKPIKDAARDLVKFYFDSYHPDNKALEVVKGGILRHIENSKIVAFATNKGSTVKIQQKRDDRYRNYNNN